jgi:hypothetical protein
VIHPGWPPDERIFALTEAYVKAGLEAPVAIVLSANEWGALIRSLGGKVRYGKLGSVILPAAVGDIEVYPPNFHALASKDGVAAQLRRIADMLDGGR